LTEAPKKPRKPATDRRNEALARALDPANPMPVRIEAHTSDAIEHAIRLADEFKLKLLIEQGTNAASMTDALAKAKVPVLVGPLFIYGTKRVEYLGHSRETASKLAAAKVEIAVGSFSTWRAGHTGGGASRFLMESAALCVASGLTREQALRAVTLDAARLLNLQASLGSLEAGRRADIVVLSGEPFESETRVERVLLDGEVVHPRKE
jgi:imidazolonepropionase-like amidohydrolase